MDTQFQVLTDIEEGEIVNLFFRKSNLSPLYVGLGGRGKTAIQEEYARQVGKPFISVAMSQYTTPSSVANKGQFKNNEGDLYWDDVVPSWFPCYRWDAVNGKEVQTDDSTKGLKPIYDKNGKIKAHDAILLFDELNQCEYCIQGWMLTATLSKNVCGQRMSDGVEFIGAMNPKEGAYKYMVKQLNPSLGESQMARFIAFRYEPKSSSWADMMLGRQKTIQQINFDETKFGYLSDGSKRFIESHCGVDFFPDNEETCFRTATEFFNALGELSNLVTRDALKKDAFSKTAVVIQKIAKAMLGERNANVLITYALALSAWDGEKIFNGQQKIASWGDLTESTNALISYLAHHELSEKELQIWGALVANKWYYASGALVAMKTIAFQFANVVRESKSLQKELMNPIATLQAQAVAKAVAKKPTATKSFG